MSSSARSCSCSFSPDLFAIISDSTTANKRRVIFRFVSFVLQKIAEVSRRNSQAGVSPTNIDPTPVQ
jgi:hypothetical protein